jgi:hypothetical protein
VPDRGNVLAVLVGVVLFAVSFGAVRGVLGQSAESATEDLGGDPAAMPEGSVAREPGIRFARVDLPTIADRSVFQDRSLERQREALARAIPLLEACDAEFRQALDEADADPAEANRDTYLPRHAERFRELAARKQSLRRSLRDELKAITDEAEAEGLALARDAVAAIAGREGFVAVFTMPFGGGLNSWEDEAARHAPLAWCESCEDLTLEVAAAAGIPADAFDGDSVYWQARIGLVRDFYAAVEPAAWEPEGE